MDNLEFNQMLQSWPLVTKVIGYMADGSPITVQVRSMFGGDQ